MHAAAMAFFTLPGRFVAPSIAVGGGGGVAGQRQVRSGARMTMDAPLSTPLTRPDPDAALVAAFAAGDARAFETLYTAHKGGVFRYFLRSLHDAGLADDLAQDVWTAVIRAAAKWQPDAKFTTWLYRLAHNRLIDHYRRANLVAFSALEGEHGGAGSGAADGGAAGAVPHEYASSAPAPDEALAQRRAALQVVQLVEALPPAQREALLLQIEGGLTLEEISAATGQGFETVKSRLRYALAKVRDGMKDLL